MATPAAAPPDRPRAGRHAEVADDERVARGGAEQPRLVVDGLDRRREALLAVREPLRQLADVAVALHLQ